MNKNDSLTEDIIVPEIVSDDAPELLPEPPAEVIIDLSDENHLTDDDIVLEEVFEDDVCAYEAMQRVDEEYAEELRAAEERAEEERRQREFEADMDNLLFLTVACIF